MALNFKLRKHGDPNDKKYVFDFTMSRYPNDGMPFGVMYLERLWPSIIYYPQEEQLKCASLPVCRYAAHPEFVMKDFFDRSDHELKECMTASAVGSWAYLAHKNPERFKATYDKMMAKLKRLFPLDMASQKALQKMKIEAPEYTCKAYDDKIPPV